MTRVGIDAHVLDGKYQGTRTWILEILRRAPLLAPDITFVVYSADADHVAGLLGASVPFEHRVLPAGGPLGRNLRLWPAAIRRDRLDLLVTQYFSPPRDARRQLVVVHDVLFETHPRFFGWKTRWRNRLLVGWSVRRAGAVATVSEYSRREISRAYGRPADRISVIRNGVDAAAALEPGPLPQRVPAGTRYALMVGRLEPRKNLRTALAAFPHVTDPDARLVVVGADDHEDPDVLAALAAEPRAIHLTGVPQDELWALYRGATVFVFPSLGEGWGIPVLEALAAGTAVVASSATAIPEAGGDACTYFDPTGADPVGDLGRLLAQAFSGELAPTGSAHLQVSRNNWDDSAVSFVTSIRAALAELH